MKKSRVAERLLCTTILAGASMVITKPAFAQDDDAADVDTVVVTGSRIRRTNLSAPSPVTQLDGADFVSRGTLEAVDLLNTLPSIVADQTDDTSNGATGAQTINLRGLGATRNLVLIDGKRLPAGRATSVDAAGNAFASDVNFVPTQLVERVDVLTGGASAAYGSDAISGVTNFVLRRDFEGFEVTGLFGFNQDNNNNDFAQRVLADTAVDGVVPTGSLVDGERVNISAVWGTNSADGRGNVTAYVTYLNQAQSLQGDRDVSRCATASFDAVDVTCLGSNFGPFPTTFSISPQVNSFGVPLAMQPGTVMGADGLVAADPTRNIVPGETISLDANGNIPRDGSGNIVTGASNAFNFNPLNFFQRPVERWNAGFMTHYDVTDNIEAYLDFNFFDTQTDAQIAPTGTFGDANAINCNNPFLSAELLDTICTSRGLGGNDITAVQLNRRNVEGGPRNTSIGLTSFRIVGGFRGEIKDGWEYDVFGQFAQTRQTDINTQDFSIDLLQEALLVEGTRENPVCTSGNPDCIPLNLFGTTPVNPAAIANIAVPTIQVGTVRQTVVGATLQNEVGQYGIQSPFTDEAPQVVFGFEYRQDALENTPDAILLEGAATGLGGPTSFVDGQTEVVELFFETFIPLIQDAPLIHDLSIEGKYRYSDYSSTDFSSGDAVDGNDFNTNTFSAGLSYSPIEDLRLRANFQRAVRAPNVFNLFSAPVTSLFGASDPCSGASPTATVAQCQASGLDPAFFGLVQEDAGQLQRLSGGNTDLSPETSNSITAGFILQPSFAPGFTLSVDYFDITIDDFITIFPGNEIVSGCIAGGNDDFCSLFARDNLGTIQVDGFVTTPIDNIASFETRGVDIEATYAFSADDIGLAGYGDFLWSYVATYTDDLVFQTLETSDPFECAGSVNGGCDDVVENPYFTYSHRFSFTWQTPWDLDVTALWRHLGSVDNLSFPNDLTFNETFPNENYLDLFFSYDVADNWNVNMGINNVTSNDPTFGSFLFGNGNTFPGVYDSLGRQFFFGTRISF